MKYCDYRDVTSVYSLNSRKLPGRFSYGLGTRLEVEVVLSIALGFHRESRVVGPLAHSKTELRERTGHSRV